MTSVCILSAAWRRFDVTRLALSQRQRLCVELAASGIQARSLVVADDENLDIAREYGCDTLEVPNMPLGHKCNVGLAAAAASADYVVWIGSDDWIHPHAFEPLFVSREGRPRLPIHVGNTVAAVELASGAVQIVKGSTYGAPPWIVDSRLLHTTKPDRPIKPWLKRGLDGALIRGIRFARRPFEIVRQDTHDFRCVDFKSETNLSPFAGVAKHLGIGDRQDMTALRRWYPADLVERAQSLSERNT